MVVVCEGATWWWCVRVLRGGARWWCCVRVLCSDRWWSASSSWRRWLECPTSPMSLCCTSMKRLAFGAVGLRPSEFTAMRWAAPTTSILLHAPPCPSMPIFAPMLLFTPQLSSTLLVAMLLHAPTLPSILQNAPITCIECPHVCPHADVL